MDLSYNEWEFKLSGAVDLPFGFVASGQYTYLSGQYWTPYGARPSRPRLQLQHRPQHQPRCRAAPTSFDDRNLIDLRLAWGLKLAQALRLELSLECFNVLNKGTILAVDNRWGRYRSGNVDDQDSHLRRPLAIESAAAVPRRHPLRLLALPPPSSLGGGLPAAPLFLRRGRPSRAAGLPRRPRSPDAASPPSPLPRRHASLAPSPPPPRRRAAPKGHLVLIGGGDKPPEVMRKFVELAGGTDAPIVAIPTASSEADAAAYYEKLFREEYGCTNVVSLDIRKKADAMRADWADARAEGARDLLRRRRPDPHHERAPRHAGRATRSPRRSPRGAVVGGTSAGTACQSEVMITGEGRLLPGPDAERRALERASASFPPTSSSTSTSSGASARTGSSPSSSSTRSSSASASTRRPPIWVRPDGTFQVLGRSGVMVFDAKGAPVTRQPRDTGQDLLGVHALKLHLLLPGETYDLAHPNRRRCPMTGSAHGSVPGVKSCIVAARGNNT